MQVTTEQKRRAIAASCGGLGELDDGQVETIWRSLLPDSQSQYLARIKPERKGKKDADSAQPG